MQLLQRNDNKKWTLWVGEGKVGKNSLKTKIFDYFNKQDAIMNFEKFFQQKTENSWADRDNFKPEHGKFTLVSSEREKQKAQMA